MQTTIRMAYQKYFELIFNLLQQLWPDKQLDKSKLQITFSNTINSASDFAFCAVQNDIILGFIAGGKFIDYWHEGYSCYVSTFIVDTDYRCKNIGTMLLNTVKEWAIQNYCHAIELDSAFHREKTHTFYEKIWISEICLYIFIRFMHKEGKKIKMYEKVHYLIADCVINNKGVTLKKY